jgi:glucose/arabinose dehydrogenase
MSSKRLAFLLVAVLIASSSATAQSLRARRIASGFVLPTYLTSPPNDATRLFVVEQAGRIRLIKNGVVLGTPFLDIRTLVLSGGERGLLGLAFHPNYATNRRFYVYFTRQTDGAIVVNRYLRSENPDRALPASAQTVIVIPHPNFSNHNGGCLQFGPDDFLYFGTGDGGGSGDPNCNAQNGATLLGKILRIDVDSGSPYAVPPSNPFVGVAGFRPEIWAVGVRNPWRFSFDALTGDLYIGDVGQDTEEEIDFTPAGSGGGENYGWKIMEGTSCFSTTNCTNPPPCGSPLFTDPVWTYTHAGGNCSVTGGYVYRGSAIAGLQGTYFFADFCSARIWSFRVVGGVVTSFTERTAELDPPATNINSISSFGEDANGELYIVDQGGEIFRILPTEGGDASWKVVNERGEPIEDGSR